MTQRELERAIARATGESTGTVRRMGFRLIEQPTVEVTRRGGVIPKWQNNLLRKEDR